MSDIPELTFPGCVWATRSVLHTLQTEGSRFRWRETGGVLLGYHSEGDIVICEATGPGPNARHGGHFFEPDTRYCQSRLSAAYERTQGRVSYLGEWHTHPHHATRPSTMDLKAMAQIASDPGFRQPEPLLWIYRPADRCLRWKWDESHSGWVLNLSRKAWMSAAIVVVDALPGGE